MRQPKINNAFVAMSAQMSPSQALHTLPSQLQDGSCMLHMPVCTVCCPPPPFPAHLYCCNGLCLCLWPQPTLHPATRSARCVTCAHVLHAPPPSHFFPLHLYCCDGLCLSLCLQPTFYTQPPIQPIPCCISSSPACPPPISLRTCTAAMACA